MKFTSEAVSMGHPDKVCDFIADSILDECLKQDKMSRVACEVLVKNNNVVLAGEITTTAKINVEEIAKNAIKEIGYEYEPKIINLLDKQSPDIAQGVDNGGAGDQGIMFGYAENETKEYMPLAITLSHKLIQRANELRKSGEFKYAKLDMKAQVTIEYEDGKKAKIDTMLMSIQHEKDFNEQEFKTFIEEKIMKAVAQEYGMNTNFKVLINPTGRFEIGGPEGDAGVTGRKIIVDTYGGYAPHGGGAFSGKDPTKVDRSATYMARYLAKNIVAAGIADKCLIQLSYAIGVAQPVSIYIDCKNTNKIEIEKIQNYIYEKFDLSPKGIIEKLQLRNPIYKYTSVGGHFGKQEIKGTKFLWEELDSVEMFKNL